MKLNRSDFFVENKIISAGEHGVVYDLPHDRTHEVWDKLSAYYTKKSMEENKSEIQLEEFYNLLFRAKAENQNAAETLSMVKGALGIYDSSETQEQKVNIKSTIRLEVLKILEKRLEELKENVKDEQKVYERLKNVDLDIKVVNKTLKIYDTPFSSVDFNEFLEQNDKEDGLTCILKFKDIEHRGFYNEIKSNSWLTTDYKRYEGSYIRNGVTVILKKEYIEETNTVCTAILKEVIRGESINDILDAVPVLLSRFYLKKLSFGSKRKELVQTNTECLQDGLSAVFYYLLDKGVLKVVRMVDGFEMFLNGKEIVITDGSLQ
ncbi:hypothetical protein GINT2_001014 [Glugoides intestinalis]